VCGLINFFRNFILNCAELLLPLTAMLKKNMTDKIKWTDASENVLRQLKHTLLIKPCLYPPDQNKCLHLFTDASQSSIGSWLGQQDDRGDMHPIAFASRKLSSHQLNRLIIHKELYAVVWSVEHFGYLLCGNEIHLY